MIVKRQYIDTKYGQQHLRVAGNKTSKPTVICLHMMPKSGRTFAPLMAELANDRLVIAPDYPGYGESDPFPEDMEPQIADYVDSIVEVINAFGLDSVHLLGYHTGSMVAVYLAKQLGPQVERLINVSAPILTDQEVVDFKQYFAPIPLDEAGTRFKIMWEKVIKFRGPEMTLEMAAVSMAENLRGGERYEDGHYAAFNYSQQYAQTIAELAQPLLVVNLGDDLQQHTLRVDEYLQNGHRVEHPEWGHGFLETSSADFASLVKDFFDQDE